MTPYLRFRRTLKSIRCGSNGSWIRFHFTSKHDLGNLQEAAKIGYNVSSVGQLSRRPAHRASLSIIKKVPSLWNRLLDLLVGTDDEVIYDLDRGTASEAITKMLAINREWRRVALERFSKKALCANMTTTETRAMFDFFQYLEE